MREDCDGCTLLGAPHLGGKPLFLVGSKEGDQAHVLSLVSPRRAVDVSVRGGMRPFRAAGRPCYWWEGSELRSGSIWGPLDGPETGCYEVRP